MRGSVTIYYSLFAICDTGVGFLLTTYQSLTMLFANLRELSYLLDWCHPHSQGNEIFAHFSLEE